LPLIFNRNYTQLPPLSEYDSSSKREESPRAFLSPRQHTHLGPPGSILRSLRETTPGSIPSAAAGRQKPSPALAGQILPSDGLIPLRHRLRSYVSLVRSMLTVAEASGRARGPSRLSPSYASHGPAAPSLLPPAVVISSLN
jgi:hypothetical protein